MHMGGRIVRGRQGRWAPGCDCPRDNRCVLHPAVGKREARTATVPAMQAASSVLSAVLPQMNWPPPRENWMIMGPPYDLAASRHEAIEHEETTFTAGMAYLFSLACSSRSQSACPVTTPGLTEAGSGVAFTARASAMEVAARGAVTGATPTFRDGEAENRDSIVLRRFGRMCEAR